MSYTNRPGFTRVFGITVLGAFMLRASVVQHWAEAAGAGARAGWVDGPRLAHADREPGSWLTDGRDQGGTFFSPLRSINSSNVGRLGFAWQYDLGTNRGQEATPIVVDGVMYTAGERGYVYALKAMTGKEIWRFDPTWIHKRCEIRVATS